MWDFSNHTLLNKDLWPGVADTDTASMDMARSVGLGVLLSVCCLVTISGNVLVLHAVRTDRKLQTVCNMFIVSLAIADLTVGLIVMPISAVYALSSDWIFGVGLCQFWIAVDYTASTASILNLFILSLDRYWSVTNPLKYLSRRTRRRALILITMVWTVSSFWLVPIVGWHHFVGGGIRSVPENVCETEYATNTAFKIITSILNYFMPLTIMYALYSRIFVEIRNRSKLEIGQRILYENSPVDNEKLRNLDSAELLTNSYRTENLEAGKNIHVNGSLQLLNTKSNNIELDQKESSSIRDDSKRLNTLISRNNIIINTEEALTVKLRPTQLQLDDDMVTELTILKHFSSGQTDSSNLTTNPVIRTRDSNKIENDECSSVTGLLRISCESDYQHQKVSDCVLSSQKRLSKSHETLLGSSQAITMDLDKAVPFRRNSFHTNYVSDEYFKNIFKHLKARYGIGGSNARLIENFECLPSNCSIKKLSVPSTIIFPDNITLESSRISGRAAGNMDIYMSAPSLSPRVRHSIGNAEEGHVHFSFTCDNLSDGAEDNSHPSLPKEPHPSKCHQIKYQLETIAQENRVEAQNTPALASNVKNEFLSIDHVTENYQTNQTVSPTIEKLFDNNTDDYSADQQWRLSINDFKLSRQSTKSANTCSTYDNDLNTGIASLSATSSVYGPRSSSIWRRKTDTNRIKERQRKRRPSNALQKEIKAAKQLGVIMGAFTVCFLPYFICFTVVAFCEWCISPDLMIIVTWIGYLNSTLNPFLYPLCNMNFRRKFREMLRFDMERDRQRANRQSGYSVASKHFR